jgi:hypothetical protein
MEPRFQRDFSHVRVHTDAAAAASARAIGTEAYTLGSHLVLSKPLEMQAASSRHLLAHELTHVVQQSGAPQRSSLTMGDRASADEREASRVATTVLQPTRGSGAAQVTCTGLSPVLARYEAGEHAQFAATGDVIKSVVSNRSFTYQVKQGETLQTIATRFGLTVEALEEVNAEKLKKWRANSGKGTVTGFNASEVVTIPPTVNEFTKAALKTKELSFALNGANLDYGDGIAMGDFYESADDMLAAPENELRAIAALIRREKSGGLPVTTAEWDAATNNRYHKLAEKNDAHFAPSNASLVNVSSASHGADHKGEWERNHKSALEKSQNGAKDQALATNAFADHFLTDAFAAGHLVNKRDVMDKFKGGLTMNAAGDFIGDAKTFFDKVATTAFVGLVETEFSRYATVASYNSHGKEDPSGWFHPNINDATRFSSLLQGIQKKEPDVLANAVAKAVHDSLNTEPGGVSVENLNGDKWQLSGDTTLNAKTREIGQKAVAQSQLNVLDAFKQMGPINFPQMYTLVWKFVPFPTAAGSTDIQSKVASGTDPHDAALASAIVSLINSNYPVILVELVKRGILKKD